MSLVVRSVPNDNPRADSSPCTPTGPSRSEARPQRLRRSAPESCAIPFVLDNVSVMPKDNATPQEQFDQLMAQDQEAGVAQAITTYEAVERAYFHAVAATPHAVVASSYAATTSPR